MSIGIDEVIDCREQLTERKRSGVREQAALFAPLAYSCGSASAAVLAESKMRHFQPTGALRDKESYSDLVHLKRAEERLPFVKMSGCGNSFVLIDRRDSCNELCVPCADTVRKICDPINGVGADGMLMLENSSVADVRLRYWNRDGSYAAMCGNGARCAAIYLAEKENRRGLKREKFSLETDAGIVSATVLAPNRVRIDMGRPTRLRLGLDLKVGGVQREIHYVETGVPHAVVIVDDVEKVEVLRLGRELRFHEEFEPDGANVNFVQFDSQSDCRLRTYERGVEDETLACGTGAVAVSLIAAALGRMRSPVRARVRSGDVLIVAFRHDGGEFSDVSLEGEAKILYEGIFTC